MLLCCLLLLPICIYSQDLGSSNDLFRKKTNTKKKNTPKKTRSTSRAKKKATPKKTTTSRKKSSSKKKKSVTAKNNEAESPETIAVNDKKVVEIEKADETPKVKVEKVDADKTEKVLDKTADNKQLQNEIIPEPRNKIIIKVGDKTTGEFADLFEKAIIEGNEERNNRNYSKAEDAYLRAQSLKMEDFRAVYGLGNLYSDQGRWEEAEKAYKTAIEMAPEESATYIALSFVLTQPLAGKNLLERYALAEKMTRRAIELDAENALAYDQLGVALELQGKISDETLNAYNKSIELDPTSALAYAHLGRLLRKKGAIKESSKAYINAIQFSVDVPTMILVADVMQSQQRYLESEQLLRRALREDPKNPTALFLLGRALTTRGNYEEAEQVLKKSAEVSPNSFVSYKLLGSLYSRQGKFEEAEEVFAKGFKSNFSE